MQRHHGSPGTPAARATLGGAHCIEVTSAELKRLRGRGGQIRHMERNFKVTISISGTLLLLAGLPGNVESAHARIEKTLTSRKSRCSAIMAAPAHLQQEQLWVECIQQDTRTMKQRCLSLVIVDGDRACLFRCCPRARSAPFGAPSELRPVHRAAP